MEWVKSELKKPPFPREVIVVYKSDSDGEPCLDVGTAYYFPDGTWRSGGFFYAIGKDVKYEIKECKREVTHWKELPSPPTD